MALIEKKKSYEKDEEEDDYDDEEDIDEPEDEPVEERKGRGRPRKPEVSGGIRYTPIHSPEILGIRDNNTGKILTDIYVMSLILNKLEDIDRKL